MDLATHANNFAMLEPQDATMEHDVKQRIAGLEQLCELASVAANVEAVLEVRGRRLSASPPRSSRVSLARGVPKPTTHGPFRPTPRDRYAWRSTATISRRSLASPPSACGGLSPRTRASAAPCSRSGAFTIA